MLKSASLILAFTLVSGAATALDSRPAMATELSGATALALAALVGERDPSLSARHRRLLETIFNGADPHARTRHISVAAAKIVCRISDVAINQRSCALSFGSRTRTIRGAPAHALYATLAEAGVPGDGAAGTIFESLTALSCKIQPQVIAQNSGGGANCSFTPGP